MMAPNGVDVGEIDGLLDSLPPPLPRQPGHIVSVSRLLRFKGIHENLRALRLLDDQGLRDWTYAIIGDGPCREELEGLAEALGLGDRVRFAGTADHREAIRHIRDCYIFSLASWGEPFGNVYAEAAICSRPVIGCLGQGAEITVRHGLTGLLVPGLDVEALAAALARLLKNPDEGRRMGARAREHIRQFTWAKTAGLYKSVMEKVVGGGGAPKS